MKRLLTAVLVLAIVPAANALVLTYDVADVDPVKPGIQVFALSTITAKVRGDVDATSFTVGNVKITGSFSNVALGTVNSLFTLTNMPGTLRDGSIQNVWITKLEGGVTAVKVPASEVFADFTLKAGAAGGMIWLDDYAGNPYTGGPIRKSSLNSNVLDMYAQEGGLALEIIPEPMTLSLLGIGGLFLRRRK